MSVVLRRTFVGSGDWNFKNLSRSHQQSQVNCCKLLVEWVLVSHCWHSTDNNYSLDPHDDFHSGSQNISHHNNSLSQDYTHPDRQSDHTIPCYPWVQTLYCITAFVTTDRMSEKEYIIKSKSKVCCCYCCLYLKYNYTYKLKYLLHQQVKRPEYQLVVYIH